MLFAGTQESSLIPHCYSSTASIEKILSLNHEPQTHTGELSIAAPILNDEGEPIWKVLVFDNLGRDIISSVLRVQDLRNFGVTIHLYVNRHSVLPSVGQVGLQLGLVYESLRVLTGLDDTEWLSQ